jgi:hypothetical protein
MKSGFFPGVLAIIVRPPKHWAHLRGMPVRLTTSYMHEGERHWAYEDPQFFTWVGDELIECLGWAESELQPIPPNDDPIEPAVRELEAA